LAVLPITVAVAEGESQVGGGALPQATLPSFTLDLVPENFSLKDFATRLRRASTPVIGVISNQRFRLDLRTIFPEQEKQLLQSIHETLQ
jgi:L-seryl-tRNA(Ser) seleniumtransferase